MTDAPQTTAYPAPWRVVSAQFRAGFGGKLIEIHDAAGAVVMPWRCFDDDGRMSYTRRVALARRIVKAVNNAR